MMGQESGEKAPCRRWSCRLTCAPRTLKLKGMLAAETSRVAVAIGPSTPQTSSWKQLADAAEPFLLGVAAQLAAQTEGFEPQIAAFAKYALTAQGKQLRPMLVCLSGEAVGTI